MRYLILLFILLIQLACHRSGRTVNITNPQMIPTINAQVISAAGTPLSEIVVTIAAGPGQFPDIGLLTDEQGRFTLHDLVAGTYRLNFAGSSAVVQQSIHLTPDTTEIIIRLEEF